MAKMREFKVEGPGGKIITVTAPENATDQEIEDLAAAEYYKSGRPKVDLSPKPEQVQILQSEYRDAVRRMIEARNKGDQAGVQRAEGDRAAVARELQRLGPNLIPGAETTAAPAPAAPSPAQSVATQARQMASQVDPTRALIDLAAAAGGAGGSKLMANLGGGLQGPAGEPGPTSGVQKWTAQMGYGQRGGRDYREAHQLEQGRRRGAKIGGIQPEFRFAKPPVIEPSMYQRAGQALMGSPKAVGALGGLSMAESGMEAMKRMQGGDPIGAAIAGAGALGGGLAAVPTIPTRVGGMALSAASPLTLYLYDKLRQTSPATADQVLQDPFMVSVPQ